MKAIEILVMFLTALLAGELNQAHSLCSKTWAAGNDVSKLKKLTGDLPKGTSFEIGRIVQDLPTRQKIEVVFKSEDKISFLETELVCETWPGRVDPSGDWGVLPELNFNWQIDQEQIEKDKAAKKEKQEQEAKKKRNDLEARAIEAGVEFDDKTTNKKLEELTAKAEEAKAADQETYNLTLAKAEDLGIEVPDGATIDQLNELVSNEEARLAEEAKAAEEKKKEEKKEEKPAPKPAAKKTTQKGGK